MPTKIDPVTRFWSQVVKQESGCWEWIGAKDKDGYGQFTANDRNNRAHRYSYQLHKGEIPTGVRVLHTCDNPPCINPEHLVLGSDLDNVMDAIEKGRLKVKGEDNPAAKLTEEQVVEIRKLAGTGLTQRAIGKRFGVCQYTVRMIVIGRNWKHVS